MKSKDSLQANAGNKYLDVIHTNLPVITAYCNMQPYQGDDSYQSLRKYMQQAEDILKQRSNQITLKQDAKIASFIRQNGKDALLQLKRDNFNTKLEDCVTGLDQPMMVEVIDKYIVPRKGVIFLTPLSRTGRAPFYSSEKVVGDWHIKTLWFNLFAMLIMGVIVTIMLLTDCPGRYIRKEKQ